MQKFFVLPEQINKEKIEILGEDVNHIKNVLRSKVGETILIGNKQSAESYLCQIAEIQTEKVIGTIIEKIEQNNEPKVYLHLFQGLPKADKMEMIIQKGTEIGLSEITPVALSRCIVKLEGAESQKKIARWQKIAETAAKQCKRNRIPKINSVQNLKNLYEILREYDIVLVAYEEEQKHSLKEEIRNHTKIAENSKIAMIVGPEGGFAPEEVEFIKQQGGKAVSLGKRILRTETAPLVMASILLYEFD